MELPVSIPTYLLNIKDDVCEFVVRNPCESSHGVGKPYLDKNLISYAPALVFSTTSTVSGVFIGSVYLG
jgi:hypothetical protein